MCSFIVEESVGGLYFSCTLMLKGKILSLTLKEHINLAFFTLS